MTAIMMICAFGLLGILSLVALIVAAIALLQTRELCQRLSAHERSCEARDNDIYQRVEQHNRTNHQLLIDISSSVARMEGYIDGREHPTDGGDARAASIPGMSSSSSVSRPEEASRRG